MDTNPGQPSRDEEDLVQRNQQISQNPPPAPPPTPGQKVPINQPPPTPPTTTQAPIGRATYGRAT